MANQRGALRKDDRLDVLANAAAYWLDYMALDSSKAEAIEAQKDSEEFARLVSATQLRGAKFVPDPIGRPRGSGRAPLGSINRSPGAIKRALKGARSGTWH